MKAIYPPILEFASYRSEWLTPETTDTEDESRGIPYEDTIDTYLAAKMGELVEEINLWI